MSNDQLDPITKARLGIVIASTRPGRVGLPIANWFAAHAAQSEAFTTELLDLHAIDLPFVDEPAHPRLGDYQHEHTKAWSATIAALDAFVFVLPEYNHGYCAPLKNAIDFLHVEWQHKPVGFVSYGGVAAGTRAVQALEPVLTVLKMTPIVEAVNIPFFTQFIDDDGACRPNDIMEQAAEAMLASLARTEGALRQLREQPC